MTMSHSPPTNVLPYCAGAGVNAITTVLIVWTTIVRDDGNGVGYIMVILAASVGAFAGRYKADGWARTMLGVAVMQAILTIAVATAPSTAAAPDGIAKALLSGIAFTGLWLLSAALFRRAAR